MKRKLIGILLFFSLVAPLIVTVTFLHIHKGKVRREIKREMMKKLDDENFLLLKFSRFEAESNIRWEHSKEFEYGNEMYDLVRSEVQGDSIFYYCWWDHKETDLNKNLNRLLSSKMTEDEESKHQQSRWISIFKSMHFISRNEMTNLSKELKEEKTAYFLNIKEIFLLPDSPPPKYV